MTEKDARRWLNKIKAAALDDEKAHGLEIEMLWAYVDDRAGSDPVAKILRKSLKLSFKRWTA